MKNIAPLLFAVLYLFQSCAPAKPLRATVVYQPGYSIAMRQTMDTETTTKLFGEEDQQTSSNTTEYEYHVTEVLPDGKLKWSMTITRFSIRRGIRGHEGGYDSADPNRDTSNMEGRMLEKMKGHEMFMTTTSGGQILDFKGADALFENVFSELKGVPEMANMAASLKKSFGDSAMILSMREMWDFYPQKPVRPGSKWKAVRALSGMLSLHTQYSYTLKSRDAQQAVIKTKIKSATSPEHPAEMDMGVFKIKYDLAGEGSGSTIVSQPDGMLKQGKHTIKLQGMMHMSGGNRPAMDVPISTKTTVTTERIK